MSISDYLENNLLDTLRNVSFSVTSLFVSLHNADPGETGTNEISGGSYARQSLTLSAAAAGATDNTALLQWTDMPADTITHVGIFDAASAGNFLWGGALSASKSVNAGDTFEIAANDLDITLD